MSRFSIAERITSSLVDISRELVAKGTGKVAFDASLLHDSDRFSMWAPFDVISKAGREGTDDTKIGIISGIATTEAPDADGDIIKSDGIDWSYFVGKSGSGARGLIIDEHPVGNHNVVGYPISIKTVDVEHDGALIKGTNVKAGLYLEDKRGRDIFEKSCIMRRAGGDRSYGFSIEGSVKPGGRRGKVVEKSTVKWLAITMAPKNPLSWWDPIAKSIMAATGLHEGAENDHTSMVMGVIMSKLQDDHSYDPAFLVEQLTIRLCKAYPQMTWGDAVKSLQQVLKMVSQTPA